ncbi:hypothetical protein CIHG_02385 [Coccidioides immitis H538.4]|uniref:Uncharacterized protein n=3 Tax=Coccidioides immitis TaxID=5501 RepID=A0A0J8QXK4_COCIT|nr:hypothetical protein CIRG_00551 [Coccidioides immitis RMSCC 2394]KMU76780.1 hypothetical protein CISG_05613 [Coccidioides immitis RMSCC 3703]KMU84601.1 hypothetical protein CIHG_02385 [Coccidioides immitis H538.4]
MAESDGDLADVVALSFMVNGINFNNVAANKSWSQLIITQNGIDYYMVRANFLRECGADMGVSMAVPGEETVPKKTGSSNIGLLLFWPIKPIIFGLQCTSGGERRSPLGTTNKINIYVIVGSGRGLIAKAHPGQVGGFGLRETRPLTASTEHASSDFT